MSVKKEFKTVKDLVIHVLKHYPETRNSDNKLYVQCCKLLGANTIDDLERIDLSIITLHKTRQLIQNREGMFKADKDIQKSRKKRSKEIKALMVS